MENDRLAAFSDGVLAIIITIMVLELKVPHGETLDALRPLVPAFASYVMSFLYVGIYWNNHHHLINASCKVTGGVLWANLHLLFWLSLLPFLTGWMGENGWATVPTALYGVDLLMAGFAYNVLQRTIIAADGHGSLLRDAVGKDWKGTASIVLYLAAIALTWWSSWAAQAIYAVVALLWAIPDRRIERALEQEG